MDRFKYRLWHKESKEYDEQYYMMVYRDGTVRCIEDSSWYMDCSDEYVIEQSTGLKDKNGKLIYENDLIKCPNGIYRIAVDDFGLWTAIYENNPLKDVVEWSDIVKNYAFNQENVELEVLGNIHENADLLGEE